MFNYLIGGIPGTANQDRVKRSSNTVWKESSRMNLIKKVQLKINEFIHISLL